ncbi:protein MENT [Perognathus longimembris pacificus]|uniref:protein MENT n=1 Tax=Perognathus longimembris pacificus TaxID=214514 RepID=UPI0020199A27|nr:protein MENT [Perognathus longimembris pacificus]
MVPAASALLWALLLSLGSRAAGAHESTSTPTTTTEMQRVSLRFGAPARSRRTTDGPNGTTIRKPKITLEDENDALATADRLAGPAAAELLATVTGISRTAIPSPSEDEDGSLEEGVVIDARKNNTSPGIPNSTPKKVFNSSPRKVVANSQEKEIRMTTDLPPITAKYTDELLSSVASLNQWSTAGSTPKQWPSTSHTVMPAPEDLRLVLMPWGPWHCHCKSGTMSRSRAGKLQGLSGRLRVGALSQLRTEHRPCTYQQCPCNRLREECPLDPGLCTDSSCSSQTTTTRTITTRTTTSTTLPPLQLRRRPLPVPPTPSPALAFWKRVKNGLEDIWNSLSSVFTEMQPTEQTQR